MSKLTLVSSRPAVERRPSRPSDRDPEGEDDVRDLASIYRRHAAEVSRWAQRLGGPGMDPEDIVHDVFLVVQRRLPEWRGDAKLSTWLYEITVRVVQDRRRSVRRRRLLWPFKRGLAQDELLACVPDGGPSIVEDIERRQSTALLYKLLDDLDDKYRTAVILFELEGLSCQEIATVTNASVQNVWVRLSRGREKLAQALLAWTAGEARQ